jgi:ankyrin repeat protein
MAQPCKSSTELIQRFDNLRFLNYAAKHWGHHICDQESQKELQPLILELINDEGLRHSSFQALQFQREFEGALADEIFESLPKDQHALHIAAYWNLIEIVEPLIETEADPSAIDSHKWTPLHWACANNHPQVAVSLVLKGVDVNAPDIQGWTPLFWAAFIGNAELIRWLLFCGADHQFRSRLGWTALHWAISSGNHAAVNDLLEHHSRMKKAVPPIHTMTMEQIKAYGNSISPIELAADGKDANLFELLLNDLEARNGTLGDARFNCIWETAKFDLPVSDNPWRTMTKGERTNGIESIVPKIGGKWDDPDGERLRSDPLRWKSTLLLSAIRDGQLSSVQMLAKSGVNFESVFALHIAAHRKDPRFVECLLENGADPNEKDHRGRTALHIAILNGFGETMNALVHGGSNANQHMPDQSEFDMNGRSSRRGKSNASRKTKDQGTPPIVLARNDLQMVHVLLLHGSDPNLTDDNGKSALHHAFYFGNLRLINLLLEFGAHGNSVGADGLTPLQSTKCRERTRSAPRRDHLEETNLSSSIMEISMKSNGTNMLEPGSPKSNNWCLLNDFLKRPVTFPVALNWKAIMLEACRSFATETLELLCRDERGAPHPLILFLVNAYNLKKRDQSLNVSALHEPFRRILSILRFSGSLINFYGTVREAGQEGEEHATSSKKTTPLALAATLPGSRDIFKDLLDHGADLYHGVDITFDPVLTAALLGEQEDLSYLLDHSLTSPNASHWTIHLKSVREHKSPIERVCFCLWKEGILDRVTLPLK